jgi:hypothetical protein
MKLINNIDYTRNYINFWHSLVVFVAAELEQCAAMSEHTQSASIMSI